MTFTIQNIGKVRNASISLDRISVIAGENGSGKSTICRALMTLAALGSRMEERIKEERMRSINETFLRWALNTFSERRVIRYFHRLIGPGAAIWLDPKVAEDPKLVLDQLMPSSDPNSSDPNSKAMNEFRNDFIDAYPEWLESLHKILNRPQKKYAKFITEKAFRLAFDEQMIPLVKDARGEGSFASLEDGSYRMAVRFDEKGVISLSDQLLTGIPIEFRAFYLEPYHILDTYQNREDDQLFNGMFGGYQGNLDRYGAGNRSLTQFLGMDIGKEEQKRTFEEAEQLKRVKSILDGLTAVIHGKLEVVDQKLGFHDSDANGLIRLGNIASGAKSMAVIIRSLELGVIKKGDLLIIDEPESNLHPEWQVRFAEFLVQVSKALNLRLLLNTHSPYFLMAIQKFANREDLKEALHLYQMEAISDEDGGRNGMYKAIETDKDGAKIFQELARPFDELKIL